MRPGGRSGKRRPWRRSTSRRAHDYPRHRSRRSWRRLRFETGGRSWLSATLSRPPCCAAPLWRCAGGPIGKRKIDDAGTTRSDRGVIIRTGEAVLAARLSSVLGALAADFEREIF
jgi:hypothetical protein